MFINKYSLLAKEIANKEIPGISTENLLVTKNKTIATDSRIVIEIDNPDINENAYSSAARAEGIKTTEQSILLSPSFVQKIEKNIVKNPRLKILENVKIGKDDDRLYILRRARTNTV